MLYAQHRPALWSWIDPPDVPFSTRRRRSWLTIRPRVKATTFRAKKYQEMQHEFAEKGPVAEKAREAEEALDGPEGAALEEARRETGEGKTR